MRHCVVPWFFRHCWLSSSLACTLVSLLHAGVPTIANSAISLLVLRPSFCWVRLPLCAFTPAAASSSSLTWFCASWSAGTPRLRHVRKDRPVFMSGGAFLLSLSCFTHVWHHLLGCRSQLFIASHCAFISRDGSAVHLWTDVQVFLHFGSSFLPLRYGLSVHFGLLLAGLPAQDSDHLSYDHRSSLSR